MRRRIGVPYSVLRIEMAVSLNLFVLAITTPFMRSGSVADLFSYLYCSIQYMMSVKMQRWPYLYSYCIPRSNLRPLSPIFQFLKHFILQFIMQLCRSRAAKLWWHVGYGISQDYLFWGTLCFVLTLWDALEHPLTINLEGARKIFRKVLMLLDISDALVMNSRLVDPSRRHTHTTPDTTTVATITRDLENTVYLYGILIRYTYTVYLRIP